MNNKFNKYCAEVMGYEIKTWDDGMTAWFHSGGWWACNPYDDLNQMAEVVEKLMESEGVHLTILDEEKIIDTCRNFIISTME